MPNDDDEWASINDLHPRLLLAATYELDRRFWLGSQPEGIAVRDIVNAAIAKTKSGICPWNCEKLSLFKHLNEVVKNDISKLCQDNDDWLSIHDMYPELLLTAERELRRRFWFGERFGLPPGGVDYKDIVHDAIDKTKSGLRAWKRNEISLFAHLTGVIKSDINHLATSKENKTTRREDETVGSLMDDQEDPEAKVVRESEIEQFLSFLEKKRLLLRRLAELILKGKAADNGTIARNLNLPTRSIDSLKKMLRRARVEFHRRNKGASD